MANGQAFPLSRTSVRDRVELAKPRITAMVVFTALVGFVSAAADPVPGAVLAAALLGTGLVATGAAVLNQVLERDTDALMDRTRHRPLPTGRVSVSEAVVFGVTVTLAGLGVLLARGGALCATVALVTWASYLFVYTPLKRRTPLATLVGAVPGALPPVIGWTARSGSLDQGAFILFAILFLWQVPHFLAIAWMYRDDYAKGGFPMLPVLDREGTFTARQAVVHSLALLLVSLLPTAAGFAGAPYLAGAFLLGVALTLFALRLLSLRTLAAARALFLASVLYLPALSSLLLAARR
jgi:protoheme IX farnesyltransferase